MEITFWGVRGSVPVPGASTSIYGGNTPCASITLDDRHTLVLDAGTGLRVLPGSAGPGAHTYLFLITHPHWDHIQGFPFFPARSNPAATLVFLHEDDGQMAEQVLDQFDGVHFPVLRSDLEARIVTHVTDRNAILSDFGLSVSEFKLHHPGGARGFLLESGSGRVLYMPDNELGGSFDAETIPAREKRIDILIHDAQYTADELVHRRGWGHSSMQDAVALADALDIGTLVLFHHDPSRTDEALEDLENDLKYMVPPGTTLLAAREGMTLAW